MTHPRYAAALQLSLLTSLGLLPLACGGSSFSSSPSEGGSDSGGSSSGGSGTAGTASHAGSGQGGTVSHVACTAPKTDPLTGLVTCQEGYAHRPSAVTCGVSARALPAGGASGAPLPDLPPRADGSVLCGAYPEECAQFLFGYCDGNFEFAEAPIATCRSGCITDGDCGPGYICLCGNDESPTGGVCRVASCATDADCDSGYFCASHNGLCGPGGFACQAKKDDCRADADCSASPCYFDPTLGYRKCSDNIECGRPFLVEAEARVAPVIARGDWSDELKPNLANLSPAERAALAAHWTRLGQLEHASIAAFARFSLQLLALGAPPELVEQCTAALADETAHAKLCFGLASAYAGQELGPGPLDISASLAETALADVVDLVIAEGCFGETSAALEALALADAATDPVLQRAYARIAADEQRHAELAFRFVRWALTQDVALVASRVHAALAAPPTRDEAARAVTAPCLQALLSFTSLAPSFTSRAPSCPAGCSASAGDRA